MNEFDLRIPNKSDLSVNRFMAKVYGWMFLGLAVTGLVGAAFFAGIAFQFVPNVFLNQVFFIGIMAAQLALVFVLSASMKKLSVGVAATLFLLYAGLNGVIITFVALAYNLVTVIIAFAITAIIFASMSVYGHVTKSDLTSFGSLAFIGIIGVIIASLVNLFLRSSALEFIICFVGLGIFIGLVAYDSQKIKTEFLATASVMGEDGASKTAIFGALRLYLDVINIFLYVLRILGLRGGDN